MEYTVHVYKLMWDVNTQISVENGSMRTVSLIDFKKITMQEIYQMIYELLPMLLHFCHSYD